MSREIKELGIPINYFIDKAFLMTKQSLEEIIKLIHTNDDDETNEQYLAVHSLLSDIEIEQAKKVKNEKDFENNYEFLVTKLLNLYEYPSFDSFLLLPIGFLIGDKDLKEKCYNCSISGTPDKNELNFDIEMLIEKFKDNQIKDPIKISDEIESKLIRKEIKISGTYGNIYSGFYDSKQIALKSEITKSKTNNEIKKEAEYLKKCEKCDNVINLIGIIINNCFGFPPTLVMEYMPLDLADLLIAYHDQEAIITPDAQLSIFKQLCSAVCFLHSINIIHLDLKPDNLLIKPSKSESIKYEPPYFLKITDFGFATEQPISYEVGSKYYQAPETKKDKESDIFSVGMILWFLITKKSPKTSDIKTLNSKIPQYTHTILKNLITRMLQNDPKRRPTIKKIKQTLEKDGNLFANTQSNSL